MSNIELTADKIEEIIREGYRYAGEMNVELKDYRLLYDPDRDENGKQTTCIHCGHSWAKHQLRGFREEGEKTPRKGWMICPDEDCNCFLTWDVPVKK